MQQNNKAGSHALTMTLGIKYKHENRCSDILSLYFFTGTIGQSVAQTISATSFISSHHNLPVGWLQSQCNKSQHSYLCCNRLKRLNFRLFITRKILL